MKAKPIGVQIKENPDLSKELKFNDYQVQQFMIAEKEYGNVDTEIKKHPEWSGTFMNYYLHREGKGQDCKIMYEAAQWYADMKLPSDEKSGFLASSHGILHNVIQILDFGGTLPAELPKASDGSVDEYMLEWKLFEQVLGKKGNPVLISGRFAYDDKNIGLMDDELFFSEGIKEAADILSAISAACQHYTPKHCTADDPFASISENVYNSLAMKLALDDMNIRGQQVIDALEYFDGNVQELYRHLNQPYPMSTRDPEIVKYVNMKAAKRIVEGSKRGRIIVEPIAVNSGASFDKIKDGSAGANWMAVSESQNPEEAAQFYKMTAVNYEKYLVDMEKKAVSYKDIDIIRETSLDLALKAAQARGFKIVRRGPDRLCNGDITRGILMFNENTGAFISMDSAKDDDVCHGGCDMDFWDVGNRINFRMLKHSSSGCPHHYKGIRWHQITHHEGLFSQYDAIEVFLKDNGSQIDWKKLGFGHDAMPVCKYLAHPYFNESDLSQKIGYVDAHMICDMGGYRLTCMLNSMLAYYDTELDLDACKPFELTKTELMIDAAVEHLAVWTEKETYESLKLMRIMQLMFNMPEDEYQKFIDALERKCVARDKRTLKEIEELDDGLYKKKRVDEYRSVHECFRKYENILHGRDNDILHGFDNDAIITDLLKAKTGIEDLEHIVKFPWN